MAKWSKRCSGLLFGAGAEPAKGYLPRVSGENDDNLHLLRLRRLFRKAVTSDFGAVASILKVLSLTSHHKIGKAFDDLHIGVEESMTWTPRTHGRSNLSSEPAVTWIGLLRAARSVVVLLEKSDHAEFSMRASNPHTQPPLVPLVLCCGVR